VVHPVIGCHVGTGMLAAVLLLRAAAQLLSEAVYDK